MKKKALKNIPKPDEDKLAIFYGKTPKMSTVDKMNTVDRKTTVDKMSTVDKKIPIPSKPTSSSEKIKSSLTHSQQFVYDSLYKRATALNQDTTAWVGYNELAKELNISSKTIQRAIDRLILLRFIERVDIANTAQTKGSKYRITQPAGTQMSTVDLMSTVDTEK